MYPIRTLAQKRIPNAILIYAFIFPSIFLPLISILLNCSTTLFYHKQTPNSIKFYLNILHTFPICPVLHRKKDYDRYSHSLWGTEEITPHS